MRFRTTITGKSLPDPIHATVTAETAQEARIKALRRYYGRKIYAFSPYNLLPDQDPSGQAGYGYELAPAKSGADFAVSTPLIRVWMEGA